MNKLAAFAKSDAGKAAFLVSAGLTGLFEGVESFGLIPKISKQADGYPIFDAAFRNNHEQMTAFLEALTEEGRDLFLRTYLPMDSFYPFVYGTFFSLALLRWNKEADWKTAVPLILMGFDFAENASSLKMLKDGTVSPAFARFASTMTNCKMLTMLITFALVGGAWWTNHKK